jgi:hypothetical protein
VPPNANAGPDIIISLNQTAVLDGSASNDPDDGPSPLTYSWIFVTVPAGSQMGNEDIIGADSVSPSFTPDMAGTYVLQLAVSDGLDMSFDNMAVTVSSQILPLVLPNGGKVIPSGSTYRSSPAFLMMRRQNKYRLTSFKSGSTCEQLNRFKMSLPPYNSSKAFISSFSKKHRLFSDVIFLLTNDKFPYI